MVTVRVSAPSLSRHFRTRAGFIQLPTWASPGNRSTRPDGSSSKAIRHRLVLFVWESSCRAIRPAAPSQSVSIRRQPWSSLSFEPVMLAEEVVRPGLRLGDPEPVVKRLSGDVPTLGHSLNSGQEPQVLSAQPQASS